MTAGQFINTDDENASFIWDIAISCVALAVKVRSSVCQCCVYGSSIFLSSSIVTFYTHSLQSSRTNLFSWHVIR